MCDCLVALGAHTPAGRTLFAKNSDRPPLEPQDVMWSPPRHDRGPLRATYLTIEPWHGETLGCVLSRPRWCWGAEHGVNEAGVAIGNESIFTTLDPRRFPPALIGMDLVRLGLERAASADDAVEVITSLLDRYGQGGSGHDPALGRPRPYWSSFLVADARTAWVIETTGRVREIERVATTRSISNRTTIPGFDVEHRHPRQPVEQRVDPRWHASRSLLAQGEVTLDGLMLHLRRHEPGEDGWTLCMHAGDEEATTASMIAELAPGDPGARVWMLAGAPCRSIYVPVRVGDDVELPRWERWAALGSLDPAAPVLAELRRLEAAFVRDRPAGAEAVSAVDALLRRHGC